MLVLRNSNQTPSLYSRFFNDDFSGTATRATTPAVNIKENEEGFAVEVAAPGFEKTDFKIEYHLNRLTISTEKQEEKETKEGEVYTSREFSYQSFSRSFSLPQTVDGDRIEAIYSNGILTVSIPKREETKPRPARMIEIN